MLQPLVYNPNVFTDLTYLLLQPILLQLWPNYCQEEGEMYWKNYPKILDLCQIWISRDNLIVPSHTIFLFGQKEYTTPQRGPQMVVHVLLGIRILKYRLLAGLLYSCWHIWSRNTNQVDETSAWVIFSVHTRASIQTQQLWISIIPDSVRQSTSRPEYL